MKKVASFLEQKWTKEELFFDGDTYFRRLETEIHLAQRSVEFETYIFEPDALGDRLVQAMTLAAQRGVRVKLQVDGIGSSQAFFKRYFHILQKEGVQVRVFHALPWLFRKFAYKNQRSELFFSKTIRLLGVINRRNHRKTCVIDRKIAYIGSYNVSTRHLSHYYEKLAWRDTGIRVEGPAIRVIRKLFLFSWYGRRGWSMPVKRFFAGLSSVSKMPLRFNMTRKFRRRFYRDLLKRISVAKEHVWITNAYFVPHRTFISVLRKAAIRGVDVRVLLPKTSDIFFMPWIARSYYYGLLKNQIQIYEYQSSFLHAKSLIVDDYAFVGSSNLNYRSLYHDLELDIVLTQPKSREILEDQFRKDLSFAEEVTLNRWKKMSWLEKVLALPLFLIRYWI